MVQFTADEAGLINRLGGNGREDTAENFKKAMQETEVFCIIPAVKD